jgi:hypothetical protein
MAEKVVIDIELKGFSNAKKGLEDLTKSQIKQQDAIKATKDEIKEYEKELKAIRDEQEAQGQVTDEQIDRERELSESLQQSRESLAGQKDELSNVNTERRIAVKEVETYNTALNAEIGSNEQLRAQLSLLTSEYDLMSQEQRESTDEGRQMTAEMKALTDKLKENESAVGDNRRNVGNYSEALKGALGNVTIMGTNLGGLVKGFNETKAATIEALESLIVTESVQKSHTAATNAQTIAQKASNIALIAGKVALNIFKLALISTGIGAFVVVLGSLAAYFASTEAGAKQLKIVMAALGSITANITSKFAEFGKVIFDTFKEIKDLKISEVFKSIGDAIQNNITNRLASFGLAGKAIAKIFGGDIVEGFKDLGNAAAQAATGIDDPIGKLEAAGGKIVELYEDGKDAVADFAKEVQEDINKAIALQQKENNLIDRRRFLLLQNTDLEAKVAKARVEASDKANLSQEQIIEKLEEARDAESQKLKNLTEIAKTEFDIQRGRSALATDSAEEAEELFQKELSYKQAITEESQGVLRLEKQIAAEKYTLMTESLAAELKLIKAQGGDRVSALIEIENRGRDAQLADTTLSETQRQAIIAESNNKIQELNNRAIDEALQAKITELQYLKFIKLEDDNLTNKERIAIEQQYQEDRANLVLTELRSQAAMVKAELEQLSADAGVDVLKPLTPEEETELKSQLNLLNEEMAKAAEIINGIEGEKAGVNLLNGLGLDEAGMEKLNFSFQTVTASISAIGNLMGAVTERNKKAIQEQVEQGVISQDQADKEIAKIELRAFKRNKALQIAMAIASTAQAVASALAQTIDPTPTQSLRVANAIAAGVLGGIQVATIAATKFEDGGLIKGASHSKGGVPFSVAGRGGFEAEGGEFIHKTKAVDHYGLPFMNALNNMQLPKVFAEGGYVAPMTSSSISQQVSAGVSELVSESQNRSIQVLNVESDFSNLQNKVNNVESARTY